MTHQRHFAIYTLLVFLLSACGTGQPNTPALTPTVTQPTPTSSPSPTPTPQPTLTPFPVNAALMDDAVALTSNNLNLIEPIADLWPTQQRINGVTFSAQTGQILIAAENKIILWDIRTNSPQHVIDLGKEYRDLHILVASPDGKQIAYIGDHHFVLISLDDENVREGNNDEAKKFNDNLAASFSPDGRSLAIVNSVGDVLVWDTEANRQLTIFSSGTQEVMGTLIPSCVLQVRSVAFTPDGKNIFSACDRALIAWDLETQEKRSDFQFWGGTGIIFTLSLDGKLLINGEEDGKIDIWEIASGKRLTEQLGHESEITSLVFSPDGSLLASASRDGTVVLWDTQSWSRLVTLEASAQSVAFSPDGNFLVTDAYRPGGQLWGVRSVSLTAKRAGVAVVLLTGGTYLEPWKKRIPAPWLVTDGSFPRYEIRITSAWVVEQSCRYGEGAFHFLERRQSTVNVEVVDLENDKIVAQKVFEGELPPACPEKHLFSATNLTDYSDGPAPDITPFEPWLKEAMAKLGYD